MGGLVSVSLEASKGTFQVTRPHVETTFADSVLLPTAYVLLTLLKHQLFLSSKASKEHASTNAP